MTSPFPLSEPSRGRISNGPEMTLVERTIEFVFSELAGWRDDPDREPEEAEERLNAQLCKYLNAVASERFPMVMFHHEEKQTGTRRVDVSALPKARGFIGQTFHTIYEPFLVFEGKRLPTPGANREREYVSGGVLKSGGIQRFKLGLHGARLNNAAMIGYVQTDVPEDWLLRINQWIEDLVDSNDSEDEVWSTGDRVLEFAQNPTLGVSSALSSHARNASVSVSPQIRLRHLWVTMPTS
jgi:hypothetical protein